MTERLRRYEIYRRMLAAHFDEPEDLAMTKADLFEVEVKKRFVEQPGQMKLLIVVARLLTGFDAPPATYLYIDENMQDHGLFQTICRVNRLDGEDKEYGYVVDYKDHWFQGHRYLLGVEEHAGRAGVRLRGRASLELRLPPASDRDRRESVLERWYRRQLRKEIPTLLAKWEPRVGKRVTEVRIRKMKTRWGSCTAEAGRIWLNLELIKKPIACLEYVLVHEMVHLHERRHTDRFRKWMDRLLPDWRVRRDELNRAPLAHEDWDY